MYSTDEITIIYMKSEIFMPVFKIQGLQFFQENILFRSSKTLLRKVFIVWYSNCTNSLTLMLVGRGYIYPTVDFPLITQKR